MPKTKNNNNNENFKNPEKYPNKKII